MIGRCREVLICAAIAAVGLNPGSAQIPDAFPRPIGTVLAIESTDDTIYLGGKFSRVSDVSSHGIAVDLTTARLDLEWPHIDGPVNVAIPDGQGGLYIGGQFAKVGSYRRNRVARLRGDGTVDPDFDVDVAIAYTSVSDYPEIDPPQTVVGYGASQVHAMMLHDGMLLLAGRFDTVNGGETRVSVAAVDPRTGTALDFSPRIEDIFRTSGAYTGRWTRTQPGEITAMAVASDTLYFGGEFNTINRDPVAGGEGVERRRLAAIRLDGALTDWNPNATAGYAEDHELLQAGQLVVDGPAIWVVRKLGASGNRIGTEVIPYGLAKLGLASGALSSWRMILDPSNPISQVLNVSIQGTELFVNGTTLTGARSVMVYAHRVAGLTRDALWTENGWFQGATVSGSTMFGADGGVLSQIDLGSATSTPVAADFRITDQLIVGPRGDAKEVRTALRVGDRLFVGGNLGLMSLDTYQSKRDGIMAIDRRTGHSLTWKPSVLGTVRDLCVTEDAVYVAGEFDQVVAPGLDPADSANHVPRRNLAAFDRASGQVLPWNPDVNGPVYAVEAHGDAIYAGGNFVRANGDHSREFLASFDPVSGALTDFNPQPDFFVRALDSDGSRLYAGGFFYSLGGGASPRTGVAAFDLDGELTDFAPEINVGFETGVHTLVAKHGLLYVGGDYPGPVGGDVERPFVAAFDLQSGLPTDWNPAPNAPVYSISVGDSLVVLGGEFTSLYWNQEAPLQRRWLAVVDRETGLATVDDPLGDHSAFKTAESVEGQVDPGGMAVTRTAFSDHQLWVGGTWGGTEWDPVLGFTTNGPGPVPGFALYRLIDGDIDEDGLSDSWEMTYFGNLEQGCEDNPDGDHLTNCDEFEQGANPNLFDLHPDDCPGGANDLHVQQVGADLHLCWHAGDVVPSNDLTVYPSFQVQRRVGEKAWEDFGPYIPGRRAGAPEFHTVNLGPDADPSDFRLIAIADLAYEDLTGLDLSNADLRRANLRGANLRGANLSGTDLRQAYLFGVILENAILNQTQFDVHPDEAKTVAYGLGVRRVGEDHVLYWKSENLVPGRSTIILPGFLLQRGWDLENWSDHDYEFEGQVGGSSADERFFSVNLGPPNEAEEFFRVLRTIDLRNRDMKYWSLQDADLRGADLSGADLAGAYLTGADLRDTNLAGTNLSGVSNGAGDLNGCWLAGSNIHEANVEGRSISHLGGEPDAPGYEALPLLRPQVDLSTYSEDNPVVPGLAISHDHALISFEPSTTTEQMNAVLSEYALWVVGTIPGDGERTGCVIVRDRRNLDHVGFCEIVENLCEDPRIRCAVEDALLEPAVLPLPHVAPASLDDRKNWGQMGVNWNLEAIRAPQMWSFLDYALSKGEKVMVGVLDGDYSLGHEDLVFEYHHGAQTSVANAKVHANHVAGIIGARHNGIGVDGVCPGGGIGMCSEKRYPSSLSFIDIIDQAFYGINGSVVKIINVSMGWSANSDPPVSGEMMSMVERNARIFMETIGDSQDGPLIVNCAGNRSRPPDLVDAWWNTGMAFAALQGVVPYRLAENVLVVEALSNGGSVRWPQSNRNGNIAAPGQSIWSAGLAPGGYFEANGTSMAAPHVSGVASFLLSLDRDLKARDLARIIRESAGSSGCVDGFAACLAIDVFRQNDEILQVLLDIDDGTKDGNTRIDREGKDYLHENQNLFNDVGSRLILGDGEVNMSDFRRWRDWLLQSEGSRHGAALQLDGSDDHPKKDLNRNGEVETPELENRFPRGDFNGDGRIDRDTREKMPGRFEGREMTDLEVLQELFQDDDYEKVELYDLIESGDLHVCTDALKGLDPNTRIRIAVTRKGASFPEQEREFNGGADAPGIQIFTLPIWTAPSGYEYEVVLDVKDQEGREILSVKEEVIIPLGGDVNWDVCLPKVVAITINSFEGTVWDGVPVPLTIWGVANPGEEPRRFFVGSNDKEEIGGPIFSNTPYTQGSWFVGMDAIYGFPRPIGDFPSVNRKGGSSFIALSEDLSQIWANLSVGAYQTDGTFTYQWEYQLRYYSGDGTEDNLERLYIGTVPNSENFVGVELTDFEVQYERPDQ